jgi:hypothetical protein
LADPPVVTVHGPDEISGGIRAVDFRLTRLRDDISWFTDGAVSDRRASRERDDVQLRRLTGGRSRRGEVSVAGLIDGVIVRHSTSQSEPRFSKDAS